MHSECGYFRLINGKLELCLSHPFGLCEIEEGVYNENKVELNTKNLIRTTSAKEPFVK
jgi:hypothetical protein